MQTYNAYTIIRHIVLQTPIRDTRHCIAKVDCMAKDALYEVAVCKDF